MKREFRYRVVKINHHGVPRLCNRSRSYNRSKIKALAKAWRHAAKNVGIPFIVTENNAEGKPPYPVVYPPIMYQRKRKGGILWGKDLRNPTKCPDCNGTGIIKDDDWAIWVDVCETCGGQGRIE